MNSRGNNKMSVWPCAHTQQQVCGKRTSSMCLFDANNLFGAEQAQW